MSTSTGIGAVSYLEQAVGLVQDVARAQRAEVRRAADLVVAALDAGGVLNAFGTGHSEAIAMELAGRAGGLVPSNRLTLRDLVLVGGDSPTVLTDPHLERDPEVAHRIYALAPVAPADVFVIASNSGANGAVVEMAALVKSKGHPLIALTSIANTTAIESRHPSGGKLYEFADVVLDNGAPYGDALLPLPTGGAVCGVSSITGAALVQMMIADVVSTLLDRGDIPPTYLSANTPGGDEHNNGLEDRYSTRIRRII